MPLAVKLAFQFDRGVQYKGMGLYRARAVRIVDAGPNHLAGEITGEERFDLSMKYENGRLFVWCECPHFSSKSTCKHLWAAVLEADRRGVLTQAASAQSLKLEDDFEAAVPPVAKPQPAPTLPVYRRPEVIIPPPPQIPAWQQQLNAIQRDLDVKKPTPPRWPREMRILYIIDVTASRTSRSLLLELASQHRKKDGEWTPPKDFYLASSQVGTLPDPSDVEAIAIMLGGQESVAYQHYYSGGYGPTRKTLPPVLARKLIPMVAATGRLFLRPNIAADLSPLGWDAGDPWRLWLEVRQDKWDQWNITGALRRGEERMSLTDPALILENGFLIAKGLVARFDAGATYPWIDQLREHKRIPFPDRDRDAVLAKLLASPSTPPMELDEALRFEERRVKPKIGLRITQKREVWGDDHFQANLLLDYGLGWMDDNAHSAGIWRPEERVYVVRDTEAESEARDLLRTLGLREMDGDAPWRLATKPMPRIVRELLQAGWHVEAEGKAFRRPGSTRVNVSSGIDWFELHAEVDYDGATASLPQLLAALRRGDTMVPLGDGSFGLLPEEWLQRFAPLAGLGTAEDEHLRFRRNQAGLLDALLAAQPEVQVDELFQRVRDRLRNFRGVKACDQPPGFVGQLREYQREGVGWMEFLREFGFGGCLADDMGVGKTAQVLAALEQRRSEGHGPSLVVAPKSVMFNWRQEAARFTPQLRVLEHTGTARDAKLISEHDLVLTTYGTMLRDAQPLSEIEFDYVVLDEAQAIKNASTSSAKAVRLLRGQHRLALSGTPIENHLGELWSLFEFLNPGMLGEAKVLKMAGGLARNPGEEARVLLNQAMRPFILRRTKRQVARELPEKTEQTLYCELEGAQKRQYDELRRHYRDTLLRRIDIEGLAKAKIQVLEALLRLRQAACHPGLLDTRRAAEPSAKLDVLMDQLTEVLEEGHKALVFSQFTTFLGIVRRRLNEAGIKYQYLDGSTTDRQARVETFQNDPSCSLFLISLKAGGLGLNLTAAEYVYLLDPWWNPAVEAQAVDRAHRIGQTRPVFAYRIIARDTVEEKVLQLQKSKRELVEAILGEDNSLVRDLKREDLELLLS